MTKQPGESSKADLTVDEGGVLQLRWERNASISEADAEDAMRSVNELCGQERRPLLVDRATTAQVSRPTSFSASASYRVPRAFSLRARMPCIG